MVSLVYTTMRPKERRIPLLSHTLGRGLNLHQYGGQSNLAILGLSNCVSTLTYELAIILVFT